MAIQQYPFTSGSHWRIPTPGRRVTSGWAERLRRRWSAIVPAALEAVTLGGVFVAPLAALAALVTLFIPGIDGARPLATPLIVGAALWLALAILCAHACRPGSSSGAPDLEDAKRP